MVKTIAGKATAALQIIASLSAAVEAMRLSEGLGLERRAAQTNAVCSTEYAWADTVTTKRSPCQVAAEAIAPCNGGNWRVPALTAPTQAYTNPGTDASNPANVCVCSWAVYNLLSACSDCQGYPQAVRIWPDYKNGCPPQFLGNTTFYPTDYLPADTKIPYWAATDPMTWIGNQYQASQAKALSQQGNPDVAGPSSKDEKSSKKSSVGPIVGGVVGGVVAIGMAVGIALWLLRRQRNTPKTPPAQNGFPEKPGHHHSTSDTTMFSGQTLNYSSPSPGPVSTGAPTIRTHVTSINSFSVFGQPQPTVNTTYPGSAPSPPTAPRNPEDVVTPFTLQHSRNNSAAATDRKSPTGMPVYDSPNAPPALNRVDEALLLQPSERPRINPPAYSPHPTHNPTPSGSSLSRAPGGSDNGLSYASFSPGGASPLDLTNQSDVFTTASGQDASVVRSGSVAQTTYTAATPSYPRDVKRRPPTDESH